jgi:predicted esterase|tara:strand:- start:4107 stop:4757 length:651 start_codon:yes stop_codon:yes gene_type:complete
MVKKSINVNKKARYYQIGTASKSISKIFIVLHGYAMLSEFFIQKFKNLDDGNTLIIAPEALNRFYIDSNYGRVGASWMTKEERESDIEENIEYLNSLIKTVCDEIGHYNFKMNILGFSQGGATACRWIFSSKMKVDNLILWAGDIPKDTMIEKNKSKWNSFNTHIVMGKQDHLINDKMKAKFLKLILDYKLDYKLTEYQGDHRIFPDIMLKLARSL